MPLVFTSNDPNTSDLRDQWQDVTGVRYHFPNMYRNMITTGQPFVYYRGVHRKDGSRGAATYFGAGVVGDVWLDPKSQGNSARARSWYCAVNDYVPFVSAVPAKTAGVFLEDIPSNMWRSGVRKLSGDTFDRIIKLGGVDEVTNEPTAVMPTWVSIDEVVIPEGSVQLLGPQVAQAIDNKAATGSTRRTRHAKLIGDRAEEIALKWIAKNFPHAKNVRWVAQDGQTPGWDIEFRDTSDAVIGVEVKGTSGAAFASFDLTANELIAAQLLGSRYFILLIADCLGKFPVVQAINNLSSEIASGSYAVQPVVWRVTRAGAPVDKMG